MKIIIAYFRCTKSFLLFFPGLRRSIKYFWPRVMLKKPTVGRSLVKSLANSENTSPKTLRVIREKDKDAEADYVSEFKEDVRQHISKTK